MDKYIACIGLMWILRYGSILRIPRNLLTRFTVFEELFKCSLCLGFWAGVIISLFYHFHLHATDWLLPLSSAACCWFFDSILGVIQSVELNLDQQRRASVSIPEPQDPGD